MFAQWKFYSAPPGPGESPRFRLGHLESTPETGAKALKPLQGNLSSLTENWPAERAWGLKFKPNEPSAGSCWPRATPIVRLDEIVPKLRRPKRNTAPGLFEKKHKCPRELKRP